MTPGVNKRLSSFAINGPTTLSGTKRHEPITDSSETISELSTSCLAMYWYTISRISGYFATITITATIYTNRQSKQSADQAADFWNSRTDDSYEGKRIIYELTVISVDNLDSFIKSQNYNSYEVNTQKVHEKNPNASGYTDKNLHVYLRESFSLNRPDQSTPSTTGAHEIGHLLGMSHNSGDTGIMSPSQDEKRTNDVMQEHINQMMKSDKGKNDLLSSFVKWYETHKNNK